MPTLSEDNALGDKQNATVILRLLLDHRGQLLRGEAVGTDGKQCGRFVSWRGVVRAIRACLALQRSDHPAEDRPGD